MVKTAEYKFKDKESCRLFRAEVLRDCGIALQPFAAEGGAQVVFINKDEHFFDEAQFEILDSIAKKYAVK